MECRSQIDLGFFLGLIFQEDNQDGSLEPQERIPGAQMRGGGVAPTLGSATCMIGWLVDRVSSIPPPYSSVSPKSIYRRGPDAI
jgi:hypothetical protein